MSFSLLGTLLRHGVRNIRHGGLPFFFATLMTALGLFGLAVFATLLLNFQRVADEVQGSVGVVAFLDVEGAVKAEEVAAKIRLLSGVAAARLVTPEEAMARVEKSLSQEDALLEGVKGLSLGWVVEVTPALDEIDRAALVKAIEKVDGVDEVMHPGGEIERVEALLDVLRGAGLFLAALIVMVTLVVVSNTVKLTLFARREEIAIMKLVGATDLFVRIPFLLEGLVQGLVGAGVALFFVYLLHATLAGVLGVALSGALGSFTLEPLPLSAAFGLALGGAFLGVFGAAISIGRFLRV